MTQMDKVTQSNASSAEQSASAAEELKNQSLSMLESVLSLRSLVSRETGHGDAPPPSGRMAPGRLRRPNASRALSDMRPAAPQIQMPGDQPTRDQDDRHFANF